MNVASFLPAGKREVLPYLDRGPTTPEDMNTLIDLVS